MPQACCRFGGWYAVRDEAFYDESELVDGKAPTGAAVEWLEEENYFFRLSAWQDRLLKFYEENPSFIAPRTRRNEIVSFVNCVMQTLHKIETVRVSFLCQEKPGDRPDCVEFRLAVNQMFESGRDFQKRNNALKRLGREITHSNNMAWI